MTMTLTRIEASTKEIEEEGLGLDETTTNGIF